MEFLKNLLDRIKQPITSLTGLAVIITTLVAITKGTIAWEWNGTIGVSVGVLLFLAPDKLVTLILDAIKKLLDKK